MAGVGEAAGSAVMGLEIETEVRGGGEDTKIELAPCFCKRTKSVLGAL